MQLSDFNMTGNALKNAKHKLTKHNLLGEKSSLSVIQVARLMDTIKIGENIIEEGNTSIYFSLN